MHAVGSNQPKIQCSHQLTCLPFIKYEKTRKNSVLNDKVHQLGLCMPTLNLPCFTREIIRIFI
jgi:hypothetical protein